MKLSFCFSNSAELTRIALDVHVDVTSVNIKNTVISRVITSLKVRTVIFRARTPVKASIYALDILVYSSFFTGALVREITVFLNDLQTSLRPYLIHLPEILRSLLRHRFRDFPIFELKIENERKFVKFMFKCCLSRASASCKTKHLCSRYTSFFQWHLIGKLWYAWYVTDTCSYSFMVLINSNVCSTKLLYM